MGHATHHAIIVTHFVSLNGEMDRIHAAAREIFKDIAPVTEVCESPMNGYRSFMVAPDGSKDGWPESESGDNARREFLGRLKRTCAECVEIRYNQPDSDDLPEVTYPKDKTKVARG